MPIERKNWAARCDCGCPQEDHAGFQSEEITKACGKHGPCENKDCDCEKFRWASFIKEE